MDDIDDPLQARFASHVDIVYQALDALYPQMHAAVRVICDTLLGEHHLIVCGSGHSIPLAQLFGTCLLNRVQMERPGLPVILLGNDAATYSAIAECYGTTEVLPRQLQAVAQRGDAVLLVCGPGGGASAAVRAAQARDAKVIVLGADGMDAGLSGGSAVLELHIPSDDASRTGECQLLVLNCLVDLIEQRLFGGG